MTTALKIKKLESVLGRKNKFGMRTAVPVIGHGLHLQAASASGISSNDEWKKLLFWIARNTGLSSLELKELPSDTHLFWESLVSKYSESTRSTFQKADLHLKTLLAQRLSYVEQRMKSLPFYGKVLSCRFANLISFNIDRRLSMHSGNTHFISTTKVDRYIARGKVKTVDEPLDEFGRHSITTLPDGKSTRIWYPYGDTADSSSIRIGMLHHANRLQEQENRRAALMKYWTEQVLVGWTQWEKTYSGGRTRSGIFRDRLQSPRRFYKKLISHPDSWYDLFFVAPLVFIGASLHEGDWPIWWMLHQRARNFVPFKTTQVPETLFLTTRQVKFHHLDRQPCNIETIEFPSNDALWNFVFKVCTQ